MISEVPNLHIVIDSGILHTYLILNVILEKKNLTLLKNVNVFKLSLSHFEQKRMEFEIFTFQ